MIINFSVSNSKLAIERCSLRQVSLVIYLEIANIFSTHLFRFVLFLTIIIPCLTFSEKITKNEVLHIIFL